MSRIEIRPHGDFEIDATPEDVSMSIRRRLDEMKGELGGWVHPPYAELRVPVDNRALWSPLLAIHVEPSERGCHVSCRMQPEAGVWTFYMAMWYSIAVSLMVLFCVGYVQWTLDEFPWSAVIGVPVVCLTAAGLYIAAFVGQRLGRSQMTFLCRELGNAFAEFELEQDLESYCNQCGPSETTS